MRFMVIVKASKDSEAGRMPSEELLGAMAKFNEEMVKAGIMEAGEGLKPSSQGKRVRFSGKNRTVIDGPFAETKELVAGFWIWKCKSREEAIEWLKKAPFGEFGDDTVQVELRQIFDAADFADVATPEQMAREERLRKQVEARK